MHFMCRAITKILVTILILAFSWISLGNTETLTIHGNKTVYVGESFQKLTEGLTAPDDPQEGDLWRNLVNNIVYIYAAGEWVVQNTTPDIKEEIQKFRNNIGDVNDVNARRCLRALFKMILKLYNEVP